MFNEETNKCLLPGLRMRSEVTQGKPLLLSGASHLVLASLGARLGPLGTKTTMEDSDKCQVKHME